MKKTDCTTTLCYIALQGEDDPLSFISFDSVYNSGYKIPGAREATLFFHLAPRGAARHEKLTLKRRCLHFLSPLMHHYSFARKSSEAEQYVSHSMRSRTENTGYPVDFGAFPPKSTPLSHDVNVHRRLVSHEDATTGTSYDVACDVRDVRDVRVRRPRRGPSFGALSPSRPRWAGCGAARRRGQAYGPRASRLLGL